MKKRAVTGFVVFFAGFSAIAANVEYDVGPGEVAKTVGAEVVKYLSQRTDGHEFTLAGLPPVVHIGETAFAASNGLSAAAFKDEEWVVRSVGRDLVLNGKERGLTLAAVHFLDDVCGIRWWSSYEEHVPVGDLRLEAVNLRGRPAIAVRDIYFTPRNIKAERRFKSLMALNAGVDLSYGPGMRKGSGGGCHTFANYLPEREHFAQRPEWFMLDGKSGRRSPSQPCLTHPQVRQEFKRKLRQFIEQDRVRSRKEHRSPPQVYDISQNDHQVYCECAECAAVIAKKGCSGLMLDFINDIASSIKDDYPDVRVMTFAYIWTVDPPKDDTCAADNVIVRFCNTKSNLAGSIQDSDNSWLLSMLRGWSRHAKALAVWDYAITYSQGTRGFPLPGEFGFQDLFRAYRDFGVCEIFMEHEEEHRSDMWELKFRLESKLMENPDADAGAIIDDFMSKYYGPAGEQVKGYRRLLWEKRKLRKGFVGWMPTDDYEYLTDADISECASLMDAAEAKVADNGVLLARVRRARVGLDLMTIQRARRVQQDGAAAAVAAKQRIVDDWAKWLERYPVSNGSWKKIELAQAIGYPPPEQFRGKTIVDFPTFCIKDPGAEIGGDTVEDPTTPVGIARRICWDVTKASTLKLPFAAGIYDFATKQTLLKNEFEKPKGEGWNWYYVGRSRCSSTSTLWMPRSWQLFVKGQRFVEIWDKEWDMWVSAKFTGPVYGFPSEDGKSHIWVDRVVLVKPEE